MWNILPWAYTDLCCLTKVFGNAILCHNAPCCLVVNNMLASARDKPEICLHTCLSVLGRRLSRGYAAYTCSSQECIYENWKTPTPCNYWELNPSWRELSWSQRSTKWYCTAMSTTYELPSITWCDAESVDHHLNVSALMQPHLNSGFVQITISI